MTMDIGEQGRKVGQTTVIVKVEHHGSYFDPALPRTLDGGLAVERSQHCLQRVGDLWPEVARQLLPPIVKEPLVVVAPERQVLPTEAEPDDMSDKSKSRRQAKDPKECQQEVSAPDAVACIVRRAAPAFFAGQPLDLKAIARDLANLQSSNIKWARGAGDPLILIHPEIGRTLNVVEMS